MISRSFIIVCCSLLLTTFAYGQTIKSKTAPEFSLKDINGKKITLTDYYGEGPIYISFWATWCKPCREELKIIEGLYEKYQECGFKVLAINTEGPKASGKIKSFVKSNGWTFDILMDGDGEVFRRKYKGFALPYTVMTDSEGNIIFTTVGFKPGDEKHVEELIRENIPQTSCQIDETDTEE
jgi:cytochrome c biogenesis protein CcmG/thiol:disulfide interchange protein DsbE